VAALHNTGSLTGESPFLALLHRLLQSGASLTTTSAAGMTPLGQLLRHAHYHCIGPCALNAARALLQAGSTLQAAGGGQAWQAVLKQALWCSADHARE
jgi:hypothetical protein